MRSVRTTFTTFFVITFVLTFLGDCQLVTDAGRRHLRSSELTTCALQRTNTRFGDRAFRLAGPSVWNSLPADLRHPDLSLKSAKNVFV